MLIEKEDGTKSLLQVARFRNECLLSFAWKSGCSKPLHHRLTLTQLKELGEEIADCVRAIELYRIRQAKEASSDDV
jgi:hypothetical protein